MKLLEGWQSNIFLDDKNTILRSTTVERMRNLKELEKAVEDLHEEVYRLFRDWFMKRDWERWERQILEDSRAGKLDFLIGEAFETKRASINQAGWRVASGEGNLLS
ncbi:MAG: hypothetical protein AB9866_28765 [Syntrophobacteraceae bacterium]